MTVATQRRQVQQLPRRAHHPAAPAVRVRAVVDFDGPRATHPARAASQPQRHSAQNAPAPGAQVLRVPLLSGRVEQGNVARHAVFRALRVYLRFGCGAVILSISASYISVAS